jgi:hypothetical protein
MTRKYCDLQTEDLQRVIAVQPVSDGFPVGRHLRLALKP